MNTNRDMYGALIKTYDRDYLGGNNNYPKNPQDAYNLLKGWNENKKNSEESDQDWQLIQHQW